MRSLKNGASDPKAGPLLGPMREDRERHETGERRVMPIPIRPARSTTMRPFFLCLGYASFALGIVGIFLPLLPTTPFVLLAVWCFARSNPALAEKLYNHPRFGPLLTTWRDQRAIPRHTKICALMMLALSYALILWLTESRIVPLI